MPTAIISNHNSFKNGWRQRRVEKTFEMKLDLMKVFDITTDNAFYSRMRGETSPTIDQVIAAENVFKKYGITKNIWGDL